VRFLKNVGEIVLDGLGRNEKSLGNLLGIVSAHDQFDDLPLALGQAMLDIEVLKLARCRYLPAEFLRIPRQEAPQDENRSQVDRGMEQGHGQ